MLQLNVKRSRLFGCQKSFMKARYGVIHQLAPGSDENTFTNSMLIFTAPLHVSVSIDLVTLIQVGIKRKHFFLKLQKKIKSSPFVLE